tara:strand:+ start:650 stop:901 length:252 start_codon:yes stop_codon:yes gene_type:complete
MEINKVKKDIIDVTEQAFIILLESDDSGNLYNIIIEKDESGTCDIDEIKRQKIPGVVDGRKVVITTVPNEYIKIFNLERKKHV